MKNQFKNMSPIVKTTFNLVVDLPAPSSISYMWNWGSMLMMMVIIQIITGILLSSHYSPSVQEAFNSIMHIMREVNYGWMLRMIHMNGASMFFMLIYIHISRGMLFSSFKLSHTWISGTIILFALMGTAFMGYVLPWGQMSFWGATVITNLISAIPYMGKMIVEWLWGGFSIGAATLNRFFVLHFMLPFILLAIIMVHLVALHMTGSNTPTGIMPNKDKIPFMPFFISKDILGWIWLLMAMIVISNLFPYTMGDPENFIMANPLNTPIHIQPEWYFLFAYAILRSIPNKLGGVMALMASILIILILPFFKKNKTSTKFNPMKKFNFWVLSSLFLTLTWIGANPVETPYEAIGKLISMAYFLAMTTM